ncbi:Uncharacterised protein [Nocardia africana]|uniref:Uncharacterized protein n=1 Tax=Nocardia africana TaxID=134964 RepID=A0A378WXL1_9NOCA|nr:Uncharacterised protein [Nocardia africana]
MASAIRRVLPCDTETQTMIAFMRAPSLVRFDLDSLIVSTDVSLTMTPWRRSRWSGAMRSRW